MNWKDPTQVLTFIQTVLSGVGIIVSVAIFILGIKIANSSKYKEENEFFTGKIKDHIDKLNYFLFKNYNLFVKKLKCLKKITLDEMLNALVDCISEDCLLVFLEIAKDSRCIIWNGNREADTMVEIVDSKKILRLAKKINENINTR